MAEALPGLVEITYEEEASADSAPARVKGAAPATRTTGKREGESQPGIVYQLKIMLQRSSPPIWRRVLVAPGTRHDELHGIIQTAFGWWDSRLHEFRVGGWDGTSYVPAGYEQDGFENDSRDNARTNLGEIMAATGDKITYIPTISVTTGST